MKICELCQFPAITYCESDEACLCWDCDAKVHGANFLVARHSRSLLCQTCQSLTPWKAVGAKLGRTVSVCDRCVNRGKVGERDGESKEEDVSAYGEEEGDTDDNQVVPWSSSTPPPPAASSSSCSSTSSKESLSGVVFESVNGKSLKRMRESTDLQIDLNRSSLKTQAGGGEVDGDGDGEAISVDYDLQLRPLKNRITETERQCQGGSRSMKTIKSLKRYHRRSNRKLNEVSEAVDVDSLGNRSRSI